MSDQLVSYPDAVAAMEQRVALLTEGRGRERIWLVEHPPLFTAGTSSSSETFAELIGGLPAFRSGRGGQVTYHGPGQRVVYLMLDLSARQPDVRAFVRSLERIVIATLARFGVTGEHREGRVGVWVQRPDKPRGVEGQPAEDKIAAIGIRIRRWVTFHGLSLNVAPDLAPYAGIVPCGIADGHLGVTSLADLGIPVTMSEVDDALKAELENVFGSTLAHREG